MTFLNTNISSSLFQNSTIWTPHPELLLGAILERPPVVQDELRPVIGLQGNE